MEQRARILLEVVAGLIPETPIPEFTKQFAISSDAWYIQGIFEGKPEEARMEVMRAYGITQEYMRTMWNPEKVNWVRCDWIYL
jgi:CTP:phosphocholine cytidylyltransferase-like protein